MLEDCNGFVLGQLIVARLYSIPLPAEFGLSTDINERVTSGEIIDAIETVEQAHQVLTVLVSALTK